VAIARRPDGSVRHYVLNGGESARDDAGEMTALYDASNSLSGWRFRVALDDSEETYNASGRLVSITQRNGWKSSLTYNAAGQLTSVANAFGGTLQFEYTGAGMVGRMIDPAGNAVSYAYNAAGMLARVTWPDGRYREYVYDDSRFPTALTGIVDESGIRYATWKYDAQGRALSAENSGGVNRFQLQYSSNGQTVVTDPQGASRTFSFSEIRGVARPSAVSAPCPACGNVNQQSEYGSDGNLTRSVDFSNKETRYTYDARGRETQRIDGYGTADAKTTTTEWHPTWNLPLKVAALGRVEYFSYDAKGQIVGFAWFPTNDSSGSQGTTAAPSGVVTSAGWTYDANGLVTASVEMTGDVVTGQWTYTYDDAGKLQTLTNGAGNVGRIVQYDAAGRVLEAINTDGQRIRYQYDARGHPILYEKDGVAVTFEYDAAGFLTATKGPGDYYLGYQYDAAHRVVGMLVPSESVSPAGSTARSSASASATNDESAAGTLEQFWSWLKVWLTSWISEARAQAASVLVPVTGASSHLQPPIRSTRMPADDLEEAAGMRQAPRVGILSIILPDGSSWSSASSGQSGCDNECAALQAKISELVTDVRLRYLNLTIDKLSLFCVKPIGKFSWVGHLEKYGNKQRELAKAIAMAKSKGCSYRSDADYFASLPPPACPVR